MRRKNGIPVRFEAEIWELFEAPRSRRWHAQFKCYPLGYFRGQGPCPGSALARAWRNFRREVDPGERWWVVMQECPQVRY